MASQGDVSHVLSRVVLNGSQGCLEPPCATYAAVTSSAIPGTLSAAHCKYIRQPPERAPCCLLQKPHGPLNAVHLGMPAPTPLPESCPAACRRSWLQSLLPQPSRVVVLALAHPAKQHSGTSSSYLHHPYPWHAAGYSWWPSRRQLGRGGQGGRPARRAISNAAVADSLCTSAYPPHAITKALSVWLRVATPTAAHLRQALAPCAVEAERNWSPSSSN